MKLLTVVLVTAVLLSQSFAELENAVLEDSDCSPNGDLSDRQDAWESLKKRNGTLQYMVRSSYTSGKWGDGTLLCSSGAKYSNSEEEHTGVWVTAVRLNGTVETFADNITVTRSNGSSTWNTIEKQGITRVTKYELLFSDATTCELYKIIMQLFGTERSGYQLWVDDNSKDNVSSCCLSALATRTNRTFVTYEKEACQEMEDFWEEMTQKET
uniref:Putative tick histamine binding protein n=1 Tax=Amblyomma tuberculatum TaxID=48802 RepID=A0A6M2E4Z9_9ACAR